MSNINKNVKIASLKKTIKITSNIIKISLENLIDDVNKKTSSIQKEIDDVIEKLNKLPGNKYQYKEKFVIDDEKPNFTNEIDELDYIHESLIFKYVQLEIKLNTLNNNYKLLIEIEQFKKDIAKTIKILHKLKKYYIPYKNTHDDDNIERHHHNVRVEKLYYEKLRAGAFVGECCSNEMCACLINPSLKKKVWKEYIGNEFELYRCVCCRKKLITPDGFHCGHVISRYDGGRTTIKNLRPICQNCNLEMRTTDMNTFRQTKGYDMV